jgi:hypothetical protein
VRDVVDDVQPSHILLIEEIDRLRILFAEEGDQHVGPRHFLLARGLDMEDGTLKDTLEAERRLSIAILVVGDQRCVLVDEGGDLAAQPLESAPQAAAPLQQSDCRAATAAGARQS